VSEPGSSGFTIITSSNPLLRFIDRFPACGPLAALTIYPPLGYPIVTANDVQLSSFRITCQPRRRFHKMNVRLRSPSALFVRSVNQATQFAKMYQHFRYHSPAWFAHYSRRPKTMKSIKELPSRIETTCACWIREYIGHQRTSPWSAVPWHRFGLWLRRVGQSGAKAPHSKEMPVTTNDDDVCAFVPLLASPRQSVQPLPPPLVPALPVLGLPWRAQVLLDQAKQRSACKACVVQVLCTGVAAEPSHWAMEAGMALAAVGSLN